MGSELLTTGSVLAAFFAGGVALFAPCCIVFLAPSYLAGAVKNRRWRILPLTFVFAAGLALVLVPITLGVSMLSGAINQYHTQLYWAGGLLMIALAGLSLSGTMWSLPRFMRAPDTSRGDGASFFALGVFSGIASSCCAPVLAGVMTLSGLSGSAAGTVGINLVPWSVPAVFASGVFGIPAVEFIPFIFFAFLVPLINLIYAYTGFTIKREVSVEDPATVRV